MIFSCGLTPEERERQRADWHDFFPLFPRGVDVENGRFVCAWLQTIQRRSRYDHCWETWINEYRVKP